MKNPNFFVKLAAICFAALAMITVVWPETGPSAWAKVRPYDGGIESVRGLWLDVPSFPLADFAEDGAKRREDGDEYGYFSFRRGLAGDDWADNRWSLMVDRYRWSDETIPGGDSFYPVTQEKAKAFLVSHGAIGEKDEIVVWDDEDASHSLSYPVAMARGNFKTGNGDALTSVSLFVCTDDYLFWVHLTAPTNKAQNFGEDDFMSWSSLMRFRDIRDVEALYEGVTEPMLEAPGYPGRARVIESVRYIGATMFKITRYVPAHGWGPKTPEDVPGFIKKLVKDDNEEMDKIKFNPAADDRYSNRFGYPCTGVRYPTGANEDTNIVNRLFIFAGQYVFDVEISIDADSYNDYWPIAADWLEKLEIVSAEPPEHHQGQGEASPLQGSVRLYPAAADLSEAPDVIVEGDPENLGGWKSNNAVVFHLNLTEAGMYRVVLLYSKQEADGDRAKLTVSARDGAVAISNFLPPTGDDWSNYEEFSAGTFDLPAGESTLRLTSFAPNGSSYVMNLRSVTLTRAEADEKQ